MIEQTAAGDTAGSHASMYSESLALARRFAHAVRPYAAVALVVTVGITAALWSSHPDVGVAAVALSLTLAAFCLLLLLGNHGLSPFSNGVTLLFEEDDGRQRTVHDAEKLLRAADALEVAPEPAADTLRVDGPGTTGARPDGRLLTEEFESAWRTRMVRMERATDLVDFAGLYALDPDELELGWRGERLVARHEGQQIGKWASRPAFVAEVAAVRELVSRLPTWRQAPKTERDRALGALRLCLDRCPVCDAEVVLGLERGADASDAGRREVMSSRCTGCNARLFEAECDSGMIEGMDAHAGAFDGRSPV